VRQADAMERWIANHPSVIGRDHKLKYTGEAYVVQSALILIFNIQISALLTPAQYIYTTIVNRH
jgi:hypothetical protein